VSTARGTRHPGFAARSLRGWRACQDAMHACSTDGHMADTLRELMG
jgi:hypothetical protein